MKNASLEQIERANFAQDFVEGVVYDADFFEGCTHYRKKVHVKYTARGVLLLEDMLGHIHIPTGGVVTNRLPKGPAQMPKKPRRQPRKGNRPETLVLMSEDIVLKVGDRVVFGDKTRGVLLDNDHTDTPYETKRGWHYKDGKFNLGTEVSHIAHVIRPWTPPAPQYDPKDVAFKSKEKCQAQKDFEAGLWVGFIASSDSSCPVWARGENVEVILASGSRYGTNGGYTGADWSWDDEYGDGDANIVAYRKVM